jgi:hypothetical protein
MYEIFEYLDIYHVYNAFYNLNKRLKKLISYSNLPIQINISTMSKTNFQRYYQKIIIPNKHRIAKLRLSHSFAVDIVLSPPRLIAQFDRLEILVLENINEKSWKNISTALLLLPKLYSLVLHFAEYIQCPGILFIYIFRLSKLKSCKITYREKDDYQPFTIYFSEHDRSPIEYLVINTRFPLGSFDDLLFCLPRLRHLSINCLVQSTFMEMDGESRHLVSKHLKYVFLNLDSIRFNRLEDFIKNHFHNVEILRLTTKYDPAYLDAKRWEQLIVSSMPNLRRFDINHDGYARDNQLTYHDLIRQFNSSFWIAKQWFFTHQHDCQERLNSGIFYSIDSYR